MDGILWATHCKLDAEALDAAGPQLRSISSKSAGIDYIDVVEVKRRGIPLGHTPGVLSNAVADLAVGLMIAASRRFTEARRILDTCDWNVDSPRWMLGQDIQGSTVGIVGFGGIGQAIVKRLKGFEVGEFLYTGHSPKEDGEKLGATFVTFDALLKRSDFVVVSCPLNHETNGMFDAVAFSKMKSTAIFVNVARGDIVHQEALVDALVNKRIYAAGLDVMSPEPLPIDNILLKLENVVLIPHLGSATIKTRESMANLAAQNVLKGLAGEKMICPV
ncbi:Glyoxylate reductase/hydroxypyruvate reductase [Pseudolycoriella hygida]|nr:Glyoxylate reductase/hydroxypyruvate reductase [Pseudolycoriella hygida]